MLKVEFIKHAHAKSLTKMKLPFAPEELHEYYDRYIEERGITDKEHKRRIWWAMFHCAKEAREWFEDLIEK